MYCRLQLENCIIIAQKSTVLASGKKTLLLKGLLRYEIINFSGVMEPPPPYLRQSSFEITKTCDDVIY